VDSTLLANASPTLDVDNVVMSYLKGKLRKCIFSSAGQVDATLNPPLPFGANPLLFACRCHPEPRVGRSLAAEFEIASEPTNSFSIALQIPANAKRAYRNYKTATPIVCSDLASEVEESW
jgi:hypothetical protein